MTLNNDPTFPSCILGRYQGIYTLQLNLDGAGFGAMILQTLNQIRYCERNNLLPVVNYDESCNSYFHDPQLGENMWDQYFEPLVPPFDINNVLKMCNDPDSQITVEQLKNLEDQEMLRISEHHEDSIYTFTFAGWRDNPPDDIDEWYRVQRHKGAETFHRYIRVKPYIKEKAQDFYRRFFEGHDVLGLHIRGTDLMYAPPVSPAEYFDYVDKWLREHDSPKVFVATDQAQYLSVFRERYGKVVIAYDCSRSSNEIVPVNLAEIPAHKKGEDVLMDMLLLSQSKFLIKGASAVGEMALYINPALPSLDLAVNKRFAFGQDYGKGWNGVLLSETKPAWLLMGKRDLSASFDDIKTQTQRQALLYKYRPYYSPPLIFLHRVANYFYRKLTGKR